MGRKANFKDPERPKKGPGRKTKKQKDPEIIPHIKKLIGKFQTPGSSWYCHTTYPTSISVICTTHSEKGTLRTQSGPKSNEIFA